MTLAIIPRCRRCRDADRRRTAVLMARARADMLAFHSPAGLTPAQIAAAQSLMNAGHGYGLAMRVVRSTGWTVPS